MTERVVGVVGSVAVSGISGLRQSGRGGIRREGMRLYSAEALALKEYPVGARAERNHGDRCAVRFYRLDQCGFEAEVVHAGDSGDESHAWVIAGGIRGVRRGGVPLPGGNVGMDVGSFLNLAERALGPDIKIVFAHF